MRAVAGSQLHAFIQNGGVAHAMKATVIQFILGISLQATTSIIV